jgi:hypothetical protein
MRSNVEMHEGEVSCKMEMHSNLIFLIMLGAWKFEISGTHSSTV